MLQRFLLGLTILVTGVGFFPTTVSAHILKTDGTIGAVLHIDPDDNPVAGQPAYFYFEFKDTAGKFNSSSCNCQIKVLENGQTLTSSPLTVNQDTTLSFNFTFPKKDVYAIEVSGQPTDTNFQSFKLSYDIRVEKSNGNRPPLIFPLHLENYSGLGLIFFLCLVFLILAIIRKGLLRKFLRRKNEK